MNDNLTRAEKRQAWWILSVNTFAFTVCFAAWMMNGVLITYLVDNGVHSWSPSEMGWLIGIPVLTGAIFRLPLGIATDKWGGRIVYGLLLLFAALPMYLVSYCNSYWDFFVAGLGFGFCGTGYTSERRRCYSKSFPGSQRSLRSIALSLSHYPVSRSG